MEYPSTKTVKIKEIGRVVTGSTPSTKMQDYYGSNFLFIKPSDIALGERRVVSTETRLSKLGYDSQRNRVLPINTTCVVCIGTIGKICLTSEPSFTNQQINSVIVNKNLYDPIYVYYLLVTTIPKVKKLEGGSASGREHVKKSVFEGIEVEVTSLSIQRKIAAILSAYDDLIENNTRRIMILEEMAQALYREWFVNFRFPGHEKVRIEESELGPKPEGWEIKKVTESILINPRTRVPKEGEKPFIPMGSLSDNSMLIGDIESRTGNSGSKFKNRDTLFARITPSLENGKTGFVQFLPSDNDVALGSTEFIVLRSKTLCPEYVYLLARSEDFRDTAIKSMTGASGRQRVQQACFEQFFFTHPDPKTIAAFHKMISPFFRAVHVLAQKNDALRQTRDLLLPKLISGEIDVESLEIKEGGLEA